MPLSKHHQLVALACLLAAVPVYAQDNSTDSAEVPEVAEEKSAPVTINTLPESVELTPPADEYADVRQIKIKITGIEPATGQVEISFFDTPEAFMKEPSFQTSLTIDGENEVMDTYLNPPLGTYAVVVVHDANNNGSLDRGFLGIGGEGYGFSNNVRPWFGWPSFSDASFEVGEDGADLEISLN